MGPDETSDGIPNTDEKRHRQRLTSQRIDRESSQVDCGPSPSSSSDTTAMPAGGQNADTCGVGKANAKPNLAAAK
jgi:hypothetical protein